GEDGPRKGMYDSKFALSTNHICSDGGMTCPANLIQLGLEDSAFDPLPISVPAGTGISRR
ncbi:MAG TPA: hypothetical protein VG297_10670, partial [Bryobacteraceae bacterium]|nr:hypothetical protein [Bryobacteraceae bacterium]